MNRDGVMQGCCKEFSKEQLKIGQKHALHDSVNLHLHTYLCLDKDMLKEAGI